jgi:hypothetical protein
MRIESRQIRNFINGKFVEPVPFLVIRAKSRNLCYETVTQTMGRPV